MTDWQKDYWRECISDAAGECGVKMSTEQLDWIAEAVQGAHETYGEATGEVVATRNWHANDRRGKEDLVKALRREKDKRAMTAPAREAERLGGRVEQVAQWLHDETDHPDATPSKVWPEDENDDGRREGGGHVHLVPKYVQERFRDIARRLLARFDGILGGLPVATAGSNAEETGRTAAYAITGRHGTPHGSGVTGGESAATLLAERAALVEALGKVRSALSVVNDVHFVNHPPPLIATAVLVAGSIRVIDDALVGGQADGPV